MKTKILACLLLGFLLFGCTKDVNTVVGTDLPAENGTVILAFLLNRMELQAGMVGLIPDHLL